MCGDNIVISGKIVFYKYWQKSDILDFDWTYKPTDNCEDGTTHVPRYAILITSAAFILPDYIGADL